MLISSTILAQSIHSNDRNTPNTYYRDLENYYDQFIGHWLLQSSNLEIEIHFRKLLNKPYFRCEGCTADYLVGEIRIKKNGIEVLNSLSDLTENYIDPQFKYSLISSRLNNSHFPVPCHNCHPNINRIWFFYDEKTNDDSCLNTNVICYVFDDNGVNKLKLVSNILEAPCGSNRYDFTIDSVTNKLQLETGQFTLTKQ